MGYLAHNPNRRRTHRARAECRPLNRRHTAPSRCLLTSRTPHTATRPVQCAGVPPGVVLNPTAQHVPQAAFPHILPQRQARCAKRHEPRSSLACPRPAASPLRACPPPLAFVAPHQPRTGSPGRRQPQAQHSRRAARPSCLWGRRAPLRLQLPRLASHMAALRAGVRFPTRHPAVGWFCVRWVFALARSRVWRSARGRRGPPRKARPRRVRLRLTPPPRSRRAPSPPAPFCPPFARGGVASLPPSSRSHRLALPTSPAARLRRGVARDARGAYRARALAGAPSRSPASGGTCCALRLPRAPLHTGTSRWIFQQCGSR